MSDYREIIAKAVIGKGHKYTKNSHTICPTHNPSCILGGWLINHQFDAKKCDNTVEIHGKYDINVWHSYNDNTKTEVVTETVKYTDIINLKYRDKKNVVGDEHEIVVNVLEQPNCVEVTISPDGDKIIIQVERDFVAEVIGETKVHVAVNPDSYSSEHDEDEVDDEEFEDLDPDFLLADETEE